MDIFVHILYNPLFNGLMFLYRYVGDLGVAIILLTILIKLILFIPSLSAIRSQQKMQEIQPKMKELQEKYKDNKEELSRQLMGFYKQHKVNPFSSCLPLLIQLPILIALYRVFFSGIMVDPATGVFSANQLSHLYPALRGFFEGLHIDIMFLNFVNLTAKHNIILAALAAGAQFWQSWMMQAKRPPKVPGAKDEDTAALVNRNMMYLLPVMTFIFGYQFPAGLALYWLASTFFQVAQQYYYFKWKHTPLSPAQSEVLPKQ